MKTGGLDFLNKCFRRLGLAESKNLGRHGFREIRVSEDLDFIKSKLPGPGIHGIQFSGHLDFTKFRSPGSWSS